jgi:hypothetical protein
MKWTDLVALLSSLFNQYIKSKVISLVMKVIGVSSGLWSSIVSFVLTKVFIFYKSKADEAARLADQAKKDKEILDKYKEAIKNNAPEQALIDLEEQLLNGGRK